MPRYIEFVIDQEEIVARAEMLERKAPKTCDLVWELLPITSYLQHAIYSGPEIAILLPLYNEIEYENATAAILPWEIGFASLRSADFYDVDKDFSELMFFYDRNTGPKMLDGPVKVNLFAQFISGQDILYDLCYRIRLEGRKAVVVRRVQDH